MLARWASTAAKASATQHHQGDAFSLAFLPPLQPVFREWADRLQHDLPGIEIELCENEDVARTSLAQADAAVGALTPDLVALAPGLRWLHSPLAGPPAGFYFPELSQHPLEVTNVRGIFNDHIGAHIMAFVLAFARNMQRFIPQQQRSEWSQPPRYEGVVYLPEATALIVGVRGIGAETARLLSAFGTRVIGTDARLSTPPPGMAALHKPEALDELLPQADFVIVTAPHTPETELMFNAHRFAKMKRGAFFINIGRGMTTKLDDLHQAIVNGQVGGAGLDVFEIEPLPEDHPLWTTPGVMITPHVAMWGPHYNERRYKILLENCIRFAARQPLLNVVDKEQWF